MSEKLYGKKLVAQLFKRAHEINTSHGDMSYITLSRIIKQATGHYVDSTTIGTIARKDSCPALEKGLVYAEFLGFDISEIKITYRADKKTIAKKAEQMNFGRGMLNLTDWGRV